MNDPIERLVEELRRPGVSSELEGQAQAVDRFVSTVAPVNAATPRPIRSGRKLRVASFIAAGALGFAGVAAAGPAGFDGAELQSVIDDLESSGNGSGANAPATSPATTTTVAAATPSTAPPPDSATASGAAAPEPTAPTVVEFVDDPDTDFDEQQCADGNHGKTVSSVAQTPDRTSDEVRDAAHSSCGKNDTTETDEVVDDPDTDFDEQQCADGNHGKTVSSVAQTPDRTSDEVRDAAHSSCGKNDTTGTDDETDEPTDPEGADEPVDSGASGAHGNGNGRGQDQAGGNGNGRGQDQAGGGGNGNGRGRNG